MRESAQSIIDHYTPVIKANKPHIDALQKALQENGFIKTSALEPPSNQALAEAIATAGPSQRYAVVNSSLASSAQLAATPVYSASAQGPAAKLAVQPA
jgi:hypothetical protein